MATPVSFLHTRLHWAADTSTVSLLSGPEVSSLVTVRDDKANL